MRDAPAAFATAPVAMQATGGHSRVLADATKGAVCVVTGLVVLRAGVAGAAVAAASLANAAAGKALKRLLRAPRPPGAAGAGKTDPGMPSSHATSLSFLALAAATALAGSPAGHAAGLAIVLGAMVALVWRVGCGYHTVPQVAAGCALGSADWMLWMLVIEPAVRPMLQSVAGSALEAALVLTVLVVVSLECIFPCVGLLFTNAMHLAAVVFSGSCRVFWKGRMASAASTRKELTPLAISSLSKQSSSGQDKPVALFPYRQEGRGCVATSSVFARRTYFVSTYFVSTICQPYPKTASFVFASASRNAQR